MNINFLTEASSGFVRWVFIVVLAGTSGMGVAEESKRGGDRVAEKTSEPAADEKEKTLYDFSIQELMDLEVTSVSRSSGTSHFEAPAAIEVITSEDIRRTGQLHMAEILRLVPGMHVARQPATLTGWSNAARGFNGPFNRFQLVQMDGRNLYSPIFSGVYWTTVDYVMADIKKVEVIRGPGASVWGANAVNGIINFETKSARDTQGLLVEAHGGTFEQAGGTVRYGAKLADDVFVRVYGKYQRVEETQEKEGPDFDDSLDRAQAGFRMDWEGEGPDAVTFQGDYTRARQDTFGAVPNITAGTRLNKKGEFQFDLFNLLARWKHSFGVDHDLTTQVYHDYFNANFGSSGTEYIHRITDINIKHHIRFNPVVDLVSGVNYARKEVDFIRQTDFLTVPRRENNKDEAGGFFQATLTAIPDTLKFYVGTKLDYNEFTFVEVQPTVKAMYKPFEDHVFWWSYARAVRIPDLLTDVINFNFAVIGPNQPMTQHGNRSLESEVTNAFEFGYRTRPVSWFGLDATVFHNRMDNLILVRPQSPTTPFDLEPTNWQKGTSNGFELSVKFQPIKRLRFILNYSFLNLNIHDRRRALVDDSFTEKLPVNNMFHARSYWDVRDDVELNAALYVYENLRAVKVSSYARLDLGVTWRPANNLEVSLWGQNLLQDHHLEFPADGAISTVPSEIDRSFFLNVKWKY